MPVQAYTTLPTVQTWKKDSYVGSLLKPKRSSDPALTRIDRMVNSLNKPQTAGEHAYKLGGLFFTTLYWNNNHKINSQMDSRRREAIMKLNLFAANQLARTHNCGLGGLAMKLREVYGKGLDQYGIDLDGAGGHDGGYMSPAKRERYRVIFRGGLAHRFDQNLATRPNMELRLIHTPDAPGDASREGVGFVFSLSNELFVGAFGTGAIGPTYHSSFMAGAPVKCAGMIDIENGVIKRIRNDSGHYRPSDQSLAQMLRHLKTIGVNISKITVEQEKKGGETASGNAFLLANGNWGGILRPHVPHPQL